MKIKLNKQHLQHSAGDVIEVTQEQGNYFKRMGMVDNEHKPEVHKVVGSKKHK